MSGEPVIERDRPVEEAGPASGERRAASGERRVAAAAEADEGAKKASVAAARSDSLLATRVTLANGQVERCLRWRAVSRAARMRRSLCPEPAPSEARSSCGIAAASSPNQQSRSYCRSGDEAGARARRACRQSSDSDEGMADGSVEVPNGSACMGSFDRLRSASSCDAPTERSPGARPRRREPRNGCRDARHDQQRAAL
jgi:hypothetical protein